MNEDEGLSSIFDGGFNGAARSEMYRSWVAPDLFPHERPAQIQNWPKEDLEMFCGIYTPIREWEIQVTENYPQRIIRGVNV